MTASEQGMQVRLRNSLKDLQVEYSQIKVRTLFAIRLLENTKGTDQAASSSALVGAR